MSDDITRRLAVEQRKRLVASIMNFAEGARWWRSLSRDEQIAFREKVLNSVGQYHDFILDVIRVGNEDTIRNEQALELIQQVHTSQRRLEKNVETMVAGG